MKFRKKPVIIDAVQITEEMVIKDALPEGTRTSSSSVYPEGKNKIYPKGHIIRFKGAVDTLEGTMFFEVGDWIITGVRGEKYPCKPGIFAATYEEVGVPPCPFPDCPKVHYHDCPTHGI